LNKKYLLIMAFLILFSHSSNANIGKYIGVGATRATLRTEGGKSDWGEYIGIGLEYSRPFSLFFAIEAAYVTKKVTLENKTWQSDSDLYHSGMSIGDISYNGSFVELATKIGYNIPMIHNQASCKLFAGPAISVQYQYTSRVCEKYHLWYDTEKGPYKYDYLRCEEDSSIPNILVGIIGVNVSYKAFGVEIHYIRACTNRKCFCGLIIEDELDSLYIFLRYSF